MYLLPAHMAAKTTTLTYTKCLGDLSVEKVAIDQFMKPIPKILVPIIGGTRRMSSSSGSTASSWAYPFSRTREAFSVIARKLIRDTDGDGRNETWGIGDVPGGGGRWFTIDGSKCVFDSAEAADGLSFVWDLRQTAKVWNPGWAIGSCMEKKIDFDVAPLFE